MQECRGGSSVRSMQVFGVVGGVEWCSGFHSMTRNEPNPCINGEGSFWTGWMDGRSGYACRWQNTLDLYLVFAWAINLGEGKREPDAA